MARLYASSMISQPCPSIGTAPCCRLGARPSHRHREVAAEFLWEIDRYAGVNTALSVQELGMIVERYDRSSRSVTRVTLGRPYRLPPLSSGGASLGRPLLPFSHPAHRTGHADLPHPALGQDLTPSPTTGRGQAVSGVRAGSARKGARVDSSRPCVA